MSWVFMTFGKRLTSLWSPFYSKTAYWCRQAKPVHVLCPSDIGSYWSPKIPDLCMSAQREVIKKPPSVCDPTMTIARMPLVSCSRCAGIRAGLSCDHTFPFLKTLYASQPSGQLDSSLWPTRLILIHQPSEATHVLGYHVTAFSLYCGRCVIWRPSDPGSGQGHCLE